jgi:hypothetical protein
VTGPTRSIVLVSMLVFLTIPLISTEKYWIARNAEIAIVGQFRDFTTARQFHGWRLTGSLIVEDSLYGLIPKGTRLPYEFDCSDCPLDRRNDLKTICNRRGLWFLRRSNRAWTSAGSEPGDPGYRPFENRHDMLKFFREYRTGKLSK